MKRHLYTLLLLCLLSGVGYGQRVGVVLSGGGASALAHIGFLKALEENNIPIDYITGSSMGAIIGGLYSAGYTIEELEAFATSEEFIKMSEGELGEELNFYFKENMDDASMVTTKHMSGSFSSTALPTNLIDPVMMDYSLMRNLSPASQAAGYDFDSLYVPFRCVASDIENKESVVFKSGHLCRAVRASSAYPFYLPPVEYNSHLLYDGGLYNNFPSDIMYSEFLPDVIIGNNVSENIDPPTSDDLISQLKNMIRHKTNFDKVCDEMVIIEPALTVGTFDFRSGKRAIDEGYAATVAQMNEILGYVDERESDESRTEKREVFKRRFKPLVIKDIQVTGVDRYQQAYIKKIFGRKNQSVHLDDLSSRYFRVFSDDKIKTIAPKLSFNPAIDGFVLELEIEKEKDVFVSFGGNFSSRPINMGFVALRRNFFGRSSSRLYANSYFGKFYGSVFASYRYDFSGTNPFSIEPYFVYNRWDYFKSFATFFEDVRPSFIVMNEQGAGMELKFPVGSKGKGVIDGSYNRLFDDYYQTEEFTPSDTSDRSVFTFGRIALEYDRKTLNKKFYANKGTHLNFKMIYKKGDESNEPGSTSLTEDTITVGRDWFEARFSYSNYFSQIGKTQLGFHLAGVASTRDFFSNYRATLLTTPAFRPIPESNTFFIDEHRANNYVAAGFSAVVPIYRDIEIRGDVYGFKPFGQIKKNELNEAYYDNTSIQYLIGSVTAIYHTPIGPVSFSSNFYDYKDEPWSFVFNFGYMIFNRSNRD